MARSLSTDLKEGDVALAAEVSPQFDDDNLRGEGKLLLSVVLCLIIVSAGRWKA